MLTLNHSFPGLRCKVFSVYFLNPQCYLVDRQITTWTEGFCVLIHLVKICGRLTALSLVCSRNARVFSLLPAYASRQHRGLSETLLYPLSLLLPFFEISFSFFFSSPLYSSRLLPPSVVLSPDPCSSGFGPTEGELSRHKARCSRVLLLQECSPKFRCMWGSRSSSLFLFAPDLVNMCLIFSKVSPVPYHSLCLLACAASSFMVSYSTVRFGCFFPAVAFLSSPAKPGLADCFRNRALPERERENPAPACAQQRRAAPTLCPPPSCSTRSAQHPPACFVGNKILGHVLQQTDIYTKPC